MDRQLYGILCRFPEPGLVKTRLAQSIGAAEAVRYYRAIVEAIMRQTTPQGAEYERVLFYSPQQKKDAFNQWFPGERLLPQRCGDKRGGDIGSVMSNALADLHDMGAGKAIITGSDIPRLDRAIITQAFRKLDLSDIVIGPADDGGYYLIGMKTVHPALFQNISWGTGNVFAETVRAVRDAGLTCRTVARLSDVDTAEDLLKVAAFEAEPARREIPPAGKWSEE
jgi:rSAM/selenodomain-associated transferase 1